MSKVKAVRERNGLSQEKAAAEMGVSVSLYVKVEQGAAPASRAFMQKFKARFPNESIDQIFFGNSSDIIAAAR